MSDPRLWISLCVLFVVAGLLNLARGLRRTDERRPVSLALGASSLLWGAAAAMLRFVSHIAGYAVAALAVVVMLYAALLSARTVK